MPSGLAKVGLVVIGVALGLAIAEVGLRALRVSSPRTVLPDEMRGVVPRPDLDDDYRREGASHIHTNHEGFRDPEWALVKPPGTVRVAVIGDSFVAAIQVETKDRFTNLLPAELHGRGAFGGRPVEVMNFGVSGYGTGEELLVFEQVAARYSPDVVVLVVFTGNDIEDNSRALHGDPRRAYFHLSDGQLVLDTSFRSTAFFRVRHPVRDALIDHLRLAQLWMNAQVRLSDRPAPRVQHRSFLDDGEGELGIGADAFAEPSSPEWQEAWSVTDALLARFHAEVDAHHARFLVVTVSPGLEVHPDPEFRRRMLAKSGLPDLLYPDRRIEALGRHEGFPVLVTGPPLQTEAERLRVFFHGFANTMMGVGHFNVDGHARVAKLLADALVEQEKSGWTPAR